MSKPLLGVIGGMGTQATACFYETLHRMQVVSTEQEYLDVLLYSMPTIPDRTAFITGKSNLSPLEPLVHAAQTLESAGASCIAVTCITSHFFFPDILKAVTIPVLNMLDETARFIEKHGDKRVCLLATDGTIKGRGFHTALEKFGIDLILPSEDTQSALMAIIYDIKRGADVSTDGLDIIIADALGSGADAADRCDGTVVSGADAADRCDGTAVSGVDAVILGCTELCVIARESPDVINTLEVLAGAALNHCKK